MVEGNGITSEPLSLASGGGGESYTLPGRAEEQRIHGTRHGARLEAVVAQRHPRPQCVVVRILARRHSGCRHGASCLSEIGGLRYPSSPCAKAMPGDMERGRRERTA
jgi:hypothetical protein